MAEVGHGLVLAVRALDIDDRDPDVRTLHETTTCFGIASPHAFRMPAIAREVHWRPRPRYNHPPPVRPRHVVRIPSIQWLNASYRPLADSVIQRPCASGDKCPFQHRRSIR